MSIAGVGLAAAVGEFVVASVEVGVEELPLPPEQADRNSALEAKKHVKTYLNAFIQAPVVCVYSNLPDDTTRIRHLARIPL